MPEDNGDGTDTVLTVEQAAKAARFKEEDRGVGPAEASGPFDDPRHGATGDVMVRIEMEIRAVVAHSRRGRHAAFAAFVLFVGSLTAFSAPPQDQYADAIRLGRTAVKAFMDVSRATGISISVGINGKLVWSEGFGYADLENKVPVTNKSRFRLGSVSKMLTAAAVARLHQEGKLDLDVPVQRYVPGFPDKGTPITTRQLAGHLAGIRHYEPKDYGQGHNIDLEHYETILDSLKIFQDDPLVASPGTRYFYSTFGYTLLSQIVEAAAKQNFLAYLDAYVFQPLGLRDTSPDYPDRIIPNRTRFYERKADGQIGNAPYIDSSYKWAGGGLLSTAEDLVRFGTAHLRPGFFQPETLDLLFTSLRTSDGKETGVGLGWRIGKDEQGRRIVHHSGSINGGRTILLMYPDSGLVIAFLSNMTDVPLATESTALTLAETFLEGREPRARSEANVDPTGVYHYSVEASGTSSTGTIEITRAGTSYAGSITAPKVLLEVMQKMGLPVADRLPIAGMTARAGEADAIIAAPVGMLPLRMRFEGNAMSGRIRAPLGPPALEISLKGTRR